MQHLADMRVAQDHALRGSLAYSSFSALTLVVAVMLGGVLFASPPGPNDGFRVFEVPPYRTPMPPPIPDGGTPHGGTRAPGPVVATASDLTDTTQVDLWPDMIASEPGIEEPGTGSAPPGDPVGTSAGGAIPSPDEFIFTDELPRVVHKVQPAYPELPRTAGMEGKVLVRVFVGLDGRVLRAEVEGRATVFDEAALAAVRQWVFTPAKANGHPVAVWMRIPVVFRLD